MTGKPTQKADKSGLSTGTLTTQSTISGKSSSVVDFNKPEVDSSQDLGSQMTKPQGMTLKRQLNFYLELRGMTAAELSRKSGVSKQVLSLWQGGAKPKNIEQVKKVADTIGVTLDNLMFGNGEDREAKKGTELEALLGDSWISGIFEVKLRRLRK